FSCFSSFSRSIGRFDGSLTSTIACSAASAASRPNRFAPWKSACAARARASCRYSVARVHQYGPYLSASACRAAWTASPARRVTSLTYAIGPHAARPAASTASARRGHERRTAASLSPRPHPQPVPAQLDSDVDRRSEQREQRDHERPPQLDREQR